MYDNIFNQTSVTQLNIDKIIDTIDEVPDCVWIKNKFGDYLAVNNAFCEVLGENKEILIGSNSKYFFDSSSFQFINKTDLEAINKKRKCIMNEYMYIKGKEVILHTNKIPIINLDGSCTSFLAIGRIISTNNLSQDTSFMNEGNDVTYGLIIENEEKRNQVLYEEVYEYFNEINKNANNKGISLWIYNESEKAIIKKMSSGLTDGILNDFKMPISDEERDKLLQEADKIKLPIPCKLYKDLFNNIRHSEQYNYALEDKYFMHIPIVYNSKLLGILNVYYNEPFCDSDATYIKQISKRIALALKNIHLYNKLTAQLKEKIKVENRLSKFLNIAVDLYIAIDTSGYIKYMSSSLSSILGWSTKELKGRPIQSIVEYTEESIDFEEILYTYNKKCYGGICKIRCKNDDFRLIKWYYYHEKESGEILVTGTDVTNYTNLQEKVTNLETKIEREAFKTEILSNISHEFKTPLNIILTSTKLKLDSYDKEDISKNSTDYNYLSMVKHNSYRLLRLVNNLIDITQIDNNNIKLHKKNINFVSYAEEIVSSVSRYVEKMDRNIIFDTKDEEAYLDCDVDKIEKVFLNLISNSIKYTETGGNIYVTIRVNQKEKRVYVSVKDDGIGIPGDSYDTIFERFNQVDDLFVRRAEGSGVGLPLAKAYIQLHNGEVYVNKNVDKGAEFIFYLPIVNDERNSTFNNFYDKVVSSTRSERINIELSDIYS
ncbi:MAG: ATP-binding protein [Clostridium sp.]